MNLWKTGALIAFGVITTVCVSYAHSSAPQIFTWRSGGLIGSCSLRAEQSEAGEWDWVVPSYSKTKFRGTWPIAKGELFMITPKREGSPLIGVEPAPPDETLWIKFEEVGGKVKPVRYEFDNVRLRIKSKGAIQPHHCSF